MHKTSVVSSVNILAIFCEIRPYFFFSAKWKWLVVMNIPVTVTVCSTVNRKSFNVLFWGLFCAKTEVFLQSLREKDWWGERQLLQCRNDHTDAGEHGSSTRKRERGGSKRRWHLCFPATILPFLPLPKQN